MLTHGDLGKDAVSEVNTPKSPFIPQIAHSLNKPSLRCFESLFLEIFSQNNLDFPAELQLTVTATVGLSVRVRPILLKVRQAKPGGVGSHVKENTTENF